MQNIKNEFEKIKNDTLSKALFRLFIIYEKSLTETENQYIFIDYINMFKKYNVNQNTLQVLIEKHRLDVETGAFFPKINQLLKPILINNQLKVDCEKKDIIEKNIESHMTIFNKLLSEDEDQKKLYIGKSPISEAIIKEYGYSNLKNRTTKDHMFLIKNVRERISKHVENNYQKKYALKTDELLLLT
jgi:hypothetical protein